MNLSLILDAKILIGTIFKLLLVNKKKDYLIEKPLDKKSFN